MSSRQHTNNEVAVDTVRAIPGFLQLRVKLLLRMTTGDLVGEFQDALDDDPALGGDDAAASDPQPPALVRNSRNIGTRLAELAADLNIEVYTANREESLRTDMSCCET